MRRPLPKIKGKLHLQGLHAPVEVITDRYGVPHIYARNEADLFFAQGYVHAQERLWQMEFNRRLGSGRVAELFANVAVIVILVALLIYGSRYTVIQTSQLYPGIAISKAWGAIAIPVSAMLMLPRYVLAAIGELSGAGQTRREQDRASRVAGAAEFTASHGGSQ